MSFSKSLKPFVSPFGDRFLVLRLKEKEKTSGGLFIPETAKEKPQFGVIVGVGHKLSTDIIKLDTLVLFGKYAGTDIRLDNRDYLLLREEEILGYVNDPSRADQFVAEGA